MLILLAGITVISLAILLYFLSPARFLRAEVADAMALSSVTNIEKVLKSLLVESPGVYIPAAQAGATSLLIPVSGKIDQSGMRQAASGIFIQPGTGAGGLMLEPPGYGLLAYVMGIGASFTDEGLESEVRDALENSLELAGNVTVKRQGDDILVSMRDLANSGMCAAIRKGHPGICMQAGCPVCSFVACAIAEGTGRMVRIERVSVKGRTLNATFKLL